MRQQQRPAGIVQPGLEHLRQELGAALDDAHEREAAVEVRLPDDVVEQLGDPVDRLRDERDVGHAQRDRQRIHRLERGAARRRVALEAARRRRRRLLLRQPVHVVVVQDRRQVHVVADRVDPVRRADAAAVAVAGVDEHGRDRGAPSSRLPRSGTRGRGCRGSRRSSCSAESATSSRCPDTKTVRSGARSSSRQSRCTAARIALSPQPVHQRGTPPW